ncbi:MAG: aldehyde dehydrogenase family protein, partial [Porticoccaceae bacterium]
MRIRDKFYIDGAWVTPVGTGTLDVIDASTEEVMGRVPDGVEADANRAVEAAARAFETWGQTTAQERRALLMKLREGLTARIDELGEIMAGEVGMP